MDATATVKIVNEEWGSAVPALQEFVRIPNLTTARDPEWETNGLLDKATAHVASWVRDQNIQGCTVEVMKDPGLSPFLYIEIAGTSSSPKAACTFVMYGHLDKQPWGDGWDPEISPTSALIRDGKMYGRGAGDDGYATFGCIIAVKALQLQGIAHPRVVILAECSEESGSPHLGHYVEKLSPRIGDPTAVFCIDSTIEDYSTFWMTTSLRGALIAVMDVSAIKQGVHSGTFGGFVPDAHRITRKLMNRVEDVETGHVRLPEFHTRIPVLRQEQMQSLAKQVGSPCVSRGVQWQPGAHSGDDRSPLELFRANYWEPSLAVLGQEGLPGLATASPVLQPNLKTMIALRLPPTVEHEAPVAALKAALETDPPCGAKVSVDVRMAVSGWHGPELTPCLEAAVNSASRTVFGKDPGFAGCGGTIPLMKMLGDMFPDACLIVTGVMGPGANEHGPNESLDLEYTKKVTACLSMIMSNLEPESGAWPDDVPRPLRQRKKAKFCFNNPKIIIGNCLCCV